MGTNIYAQTEIIFSLGLIFLYRLCHVVDLTDIPKNYFRTSNFQTGGQTHAGGDVENPL